MTTLGYATSKLYGGQFSSSGGAETEEGVTIEPDNNQFSGIVFKIQANMNPSTATESHSFVS